MADIRLQDGQGVRKGPGYLQGDGRRFLWIFYRDDDIRRKPFRQAGHPPAEAAAGAAVEDNEAIEEERDE